MALENNPIVIKSLIPCFDREVSVPGIGNFDVSSETYEWGSFFEAYKHATDCGGVLSPADLETALFVGDTEGSIRNASLYTWNLSAALYLHENGWQFGVSHELEREKSVYANLQDFMEQTKNRQWIWSLSSKEGLGKLVVEAVKAGEGFTPIPTTFPYVVPSLELGKDPIARRLRGPYTQAFGEKLAAAGISEQYFYVLTHAHLMNKSSDALIVCPVGLGGDGDLGNVYALGGSDGGCSRPVALTQKISP